MYIFLQFFVSHKTRILILDIWQCPYEVKLFDMANRVSVYNMWSWFFFVLFIDAVCQGEYATCVNKLEKDLVSNYQQQFEALFNAEAPTWETHGNLMVSISLFLPLLNLHINIELGYMYSWKNIPDLVWLSSEL